MTHYERLGIEPTASADEVRFAYRRLARLYHPDAHAGAHVDEMAALNDAWRVLSDPGRRRMYDASLRPGARATTGPGFRSTESLRLSEERYPVAPQAFHQGPHRFPIGWMVVAGIVVMVLIIVAGNIVSGGKNSPASRQMLQAGACLKVLENLDVSVVPCADEHDGYAVSVIPFDEVCPANLESHRDRQGLGFACMKRSKGPPPT